MTPYSAPGVYDISERIIIDLITRVFDLGSDYWLSGKFESQKEVIPRQILHACLIDYMGYSFHKAGAVTLQSHLTARRGRLRVHETLLRCKDLRPKIELIFLDCKKRTSCKNIGNFAI